MDPPANAAQAPASGSYAEVSLVTLPNASCRLHPENSLDPKVTLEVFADEDGVLRFFAWKPTPGDSNLTRHTLDCTTPDGRAATHSLDFSSPSTYEPLAAASLAPTDARLRPALQGDAMAYTRGELIRNGYGFRPDPTGEPERFSQWLAAATTPAKRVSYQPRPTGRSAHVYQQQAWGGIVLTHPPYIEADGRMHLPTLTASADTNTGAAAWVGVGGIGDGLIQSGVTLTTAPGYFAYQSFIEYAGGSQDTGRCQYNLCPFPLYAFPGDDFIAQAWACDRYGNDDMAGAYGCYYLINLTHRTSPCDGNPKCPYAQVLDCTSANDPICPSVLRPAHSAFHGGTAEVIVERLDGYDVPNYGTFPFAMDAFDPSYNIRNRSTDPYDLIILSSSDLRRALQWVTFDRTLDSVNFTWLASY
jgi:hypothetical protein